MFIQSQGLVKNIQPLDDNMLDFLCDYNVILDWIFESMVERREFDWKCFESFKLE